MATTTSPTASDLPSLRPTVPGASLSAAGNAPFNSPRNAEPRPRVFEESAESPKPLKRILVVDDDCDTLASLAMTLAERHEVGVAADAASAMRRLLSQQYDLIVLDVRLPDLDPEKLVRSLREGHTGTPIILISAYSDLPARARDLQVSAYLEKPFSVEQLEAAVDAILGRAEPQSPRP